MGVPIHKDLSSETPFFIGGSVRQLLAANGSHTLQAETEEGERIMLHSAYDPGREAKSFVDGLGLKAGAKVILFGLGLGYHLREILRRVGENGKVVALEANPGVFRAALELIDFTDLYSGTKVDLLAGLGEDEMMGGLKSLLEGDLKDVPVDELDVVVHPSSLRVTPKRFRGIKDYLQGVVAARKTCQLFGDLTLRNLQLNTPHVLDGVPVELLFGKFKGTASFLVGAGPSLGDRQIMQLKKAKNKALIVAVGTALKPLLGCGVEPDLVVATDPQNESYRHFEGVEDCESPLIFLPTVCPDIVRKYRGRKVVAFQEDYPEVGRMADALSRTKVKTGGSVLTTALDILIRMASDPIIFVGCDLGYPRGVGHAGGTIWDERWREVVVNSRFSTLEEENRKYIDGGEKVWVEGVNGREILTHLNLKSYLSWIENRLKDEPGWFINASGGAHIRGADSMKVEEAVEKYCSVESKDMKGYLSGLLERNWETQPARNLGS